jgi:PAS domain S-box-containing protein
MTPFDARAILPDAQKIRAAFDGATIGFAMTVPSGTFVDANPAYCRITGYSVNELRRMEFRQLVHPEDHDRNVELNERMRAGVIPGFVLENRYVRKGVLDEKEWEKHVKGLPDLAEQAAPVEASIEGEDLDDEEPEGNP